MNGIRSAAALFAVGIALMMTSCGPGESTAFTARQMAEAIMASQTGLPPMSVMTSDEGHFELHIEENYLLDPATLQEGAVLYAEGTQASEIAVLRLGEAAAPEQVEEALAEYLERRAQSFAGYFPEQEALIQDGIVAANGEYVALLICREPVEAESAFLACFSDTPPELPASPLPVVPLPSAPEQVTQVAPEGPAAPEEPDTPDEEAAAVDVFAAQPIEENTLPDEYDAAAILEAWQSGDSSGLGERNRAILELCASTVDELIAEDMADHEKELAIHDWIAGHTAYDEGLLSNAPEAEPHPENDNPYGLLVGQQAACEGYASTFQLFMDMLEIECITVHGTDLWGYEEHVWNMVRLDDGEWYCVDVTWDDTADVLGRKGEPTGRKYFNVTSDYMRYNDHQWDPEGIPVATSERFM
jgi:hypothetical protein